MAQYPPIKFIIDMMGFDLLITILNEQAKDNPYEAFRKMAEALIAKFMTYGKIEIRQDSTVVDLRMYPREAENTIWLLLAALCRYVEAEEEYSQELKVKIIQNLDEGMK